MSIADLIYIAAMVATPIIIVRNWKAIVWCFRTALGVAEAPAPADVPFPRTPQPAIVHEHVGYFDSQQMHDYALRYSRSVLRATAGVKVVPAPQAWRGLTKDEIDHAVGELIEYGTDFVAPLYSVVEGIERKLRERNDGVGGLDGSQR